MSNNFNTNHRKKLKTQITNLIISGTPKEVPKYNNNCPNHFGSHTPDFYAKIY